LLSDFFIGKYSFINEVLFEGNITDLLGSDIEVRKIENCCLYDVSYQTIENIDTIELAMLYVIEVFCEVHPNKKQEVSTIGQKIYGENKLLISKSIIKEQKHTTSHNYCVIQHLNNIAFYTQTLKNHDVYLTITANIEGIILNEPHEDFWICDQINMDPPMEDEVRDGRQLLNSINTKDMVSLFENFLQLVKGVCNHEANHINKVNKEQPEQENVDLKDEINELKKRIYDLKSEINRRGYIINGLLKIIKPL